MEIVVAIFLFVVFCVYIYLFYLVFSKDLQNRARLQLFHNAVISVYERNKELDSIAVVVEEIELNYNKVFQLQKERNKIALLDLIDEVISIYDTRSDKGFKSIFKRERYEGLPKFLLKVSQFIKESDPFSALSEKNAALLKNLSEALEKTNFELGQVTIKQLSSELQNKESLVKKQQRENQRATMISIVGIVLTIVFGIFSIL